MNLNQLNTTRDLSFFVRLSINNELLHQQEVKYCQMVADNFGKLSEDVALVNITPFSSQQLSSFGKYRESLFHLLQLQQYIRHQLKQHQTERLHPKIIASASPSGTFQTSP